MIKLIKIILLITITASCSSDKGTASRKDKTPPPVPRIVSSVGNNYYSSTDSVDLLLDVPENTDNVEIFLTSDCSGPPHSSENSFFSPMTVSGLNEENESQDIYAIAKDESGKEIVSCSKVLEFTHDNISPPDFSKPSQFEEDSNGLTIGGVSGQVSMPISDIDLDDDIEFIKIYSDSSKTHLLATILKADFNNGTYELDTTSLSEGNYTLYIVGEDFARNETSAINTDITITIDATPPAYPSGPTLSDTSGSVYDETIDATFFADLTDTVEVRFLVNGEVYEIISPLTSNPVSSTGIPLDLGNNEIEIELLDEFGNILTYAFGDVDRVAPPSYTSFVLDNEPPYKEVNTVATFSMAPGADVSFVASGVSVTPTTGDESDLSSGLSITVPGYSIDREDLVIDVTDNENGEVRQFTFEIYARQPGFQNNMSYEHISRDLTFDNSVEISFEPRFYLMSSEVGGLTLTSGDPDGFTFSETFSLIVGENRAEYDYIDIFGTTRSYLANTVKREFINDKFDVGGDHACYIGSLGLPACWGDNEFGQLGYDDTGGHLPSPIESSGTYFSREAVTQITSGRNHTCALESINNKVVCWGDNEFGQLGIGHTSPTVIGKPEIVSNSDEFTNGNARFVDSEGNSTCIISNDDSLACWSSNNLFKDGIYSYSSYDNAPVSLNGEMDSNDISKVSVGSTHACAVENNGSLYCWGGNGSGQLGIGTQTTSESSTLVNSSNGFVGTDVIDVSVGYRHTCAIDVSNRVFCWGYNNKKQVQSEQSPASYSSPELVADFSSFTNANIKKVSLGENNTFVIDDQDNLFCWGENSSGQCGTASDLGNIDPVSVDTLNGFDSGNVAHVSAGSDHACASDNDGKIYCWGNNDKLKLGRSGADSPSPVLLDIGNIDSN